MFFFFTFSLHVTTPSNSIDILGIGIDSLCSTDVRQFKIDITFLANKKEPKTLLIPLSDVCTIGNSFFFQFIRYCSRFFCVCRFIRYFATVQSKQKSISFGGKRCIFLSFFHSNVLPSHCSCALSLRSFHFATYFRLCPMQNAPIFPPEERRTHKLNNNSNRILFILTMLWFDAFNLCTHFGVLQRFFQFVRSKSRKYCYLLRFPFLVALLCAESAHNNFRCVTLCLMLFAMDCM